MDEMFGRTDSVKGRPPTLGVPRGRVKNTAPCLIRENEKTVQLTDYNTPEIEIDRVLR